MVRINKNTANFIGYEMGQNCMLLKIMNKKFIEDINRENAR